MKITDEAGQRAITWLAMEIANATETHLNQIAIALIAIVHGTIPDWVVKEMTARGFS